MSRRRIGISGLVVLMIAIGTWLASPKHSSSSGSAVTQVPVREAQVQPAGTSTRPVTVTILDLWARPPAKVAARHLRRTRFAPLRKFGANEQLVDRLTDGDALGVVTDLTEKAKRGDPSAANI